MRVSFDLSIRGGAAKSMQDIYALALKLITVRIHDTLDEISSIANLGQIEQEKLAIDKSFGDLFSEAKIRAAKKDLELEYRVEVDLRDLSLRDYFRIRQILGNLVENAIEYTEKGRISIRMRQFESGQLWLEVQDTGPSIPPEAESYFFQAVRQTNIDIPSQYGRGLGLFIVRHLVNWMNGEFVLNSELGEGNTFEVTLPLPAETEEKLNNDSSKGSTKAELPE
jgi:signal transduction histidine kinase